MKKYQTAIIAFIGLLIIAIAAVGYRSMQKKEVVIPEDKEELVQAMRLSGVSMQVRLASTTETITVRPTGALGYMIEEEGEEPRIEEVTAAPEDMQAIARALDASNYFALESQGAGKLRDEVLYEFQGGLVPAEDETAENEVIHVIACYASACSEDLLAIRDALEGAWGGTLENK